jgi:hemoglobin-like flavoprotein
MGDVTLQPRTISTVKATAPVLREHGLELTQRMYALLFQDEQIKSLFNQSHHRGVGTQPRSLAGAVHAYAANIDRLEELGPVVERIAQKHVALNILPEHYPAVGRALIGALGDVLGQAATEEVVAAWTEAYQFLAQLLMGREQALYDQRAAAPGGWLGWREFVVDRVVPESEVITSFYLVPRDGGPIMGFRPGQYLTFQLDIPGHGQVVRNYSVSCVSGQGPTASVSSMKAEGSSSHGRLLVAGRGGGRGPRDGRVDQSSIRAGSPMVSCGWAAQSSRRPLHHKAMTHTERARTRPPATTLRQWGRHGSHPRRAGRPSTG